MIFRKAKIKDVEQLVAIRRIQLQDEGQLTDVDIDQNLRLFFEQKIKNGDLVEWVAEDDDGMIIATAAVLFMEFPPAFTNPKGNKGYITNMYTADEYRRQGIASQLMKKLEQEAKKRGVTKLVLHASEIGRKAYVKCGYSETGTVMEKDIAD